MPVYFEKHIDGETRLAIWKITEDESFFNVPLQYDITHHHKRLQHLAGRYLLQYLFPDFPLELIKVADTKKPYLDNESHHFSISHCGDFAAAIVSTGKRVGLDIEVPSEKVIRVREKFLDGKELVGLSNRGAADDIGRLTMYWSAKEAVFKWWSYGKVDFRTMISILPEPDLSADRIFCTFRSPRQQYDLTVNTYHTPDLVLAWLATESNK